MLDLAPVSCPPPPGVSCEFIPMNGANVTRVAGADSGILAQSDGNGNDFDDIDWSKVMNIFDFDTQFNNSNNDEKANDGPTPEVENGGRGFESTELTQMGSFGCHDNSNRLCMRRDVDALACFDAGHPVGCRKCQRAPPEGKEHEYKLVRAEGDGGESMTGEKRLRKLIAKCDEWTVDAERLKTVRLARTAKYDDLADLLAEKNVPKLRKHHLMQFCRILGKRCNIWQSRTQFMETHRDDEEAMRMSERVSYVARPSSALVLAGSVPVGPDSFPAVGAGLVQGQGAEGPPGLVQRQWVATPEEEPRRDSCSSRLRSSDYSGGSSLGPTRDVEPISEHETHVQLLNYRRAGCDGSRPTRPEQRTERVFGFDEGELRRQRRDPLAKPFASNAVAVIAKAESMADAVLRSCPDAPEYVRLESLLNLHMKDRRMSSVRASFSESQRVMARMQAVRMELAQIRLRYRSGGDMAVVSYMTGTTDGSRVSSFCNVLGEGDDSFNPDCECPVVRAIEGVLSGINRHMKERMAQTENGQHIGLIAERVRMLSECGYTDEASAMKNFLVRKSEDPSFPVPKEGPASYFLTHMYFKTRITSLLDYIKSVVLHCHHKDADDYAKICLKMVSLIEATFVGVKEVWATLDYVPLRVVMEMLQQ
jgi:hypothetical protein